ncbi:B_lectin domain-containing protein/Pkinase_Tyr domain-containing protein/PAN_2 domain-containing protein [Cephalotus follicularis]|uniref:B_lectin domain-containing protein/Pkinase_Tyr domain-containing protein/PAN_2 domain-containing protein n=1 Tax=Cephalotus follicularis TaxID=3775 RepID=A0A1Q3D9K6_CEPFO|nr:B_lectin domain-containing protein/Pkinase_Tyr domain-containing protein/PAN_2 domain-containing protein [Cephalotus follicularis]
MASSAVSYVLFIFIFLLSHFSKANIILNTSMSTTNGMSSWLSGDFAFGFRQLNNSDLFLLAIWFNKIPDRTIVWQANGNNPTKSGSKVELTASGLVLYDPSGQSIWEAKPATNVSYAVMLDNGNFVLAGNDSFYAWETFKNPTDTILPTQILDLGGMLYSRLQTNYSKGRFELHFWNGNLELNPIAWPSEFRYNQYYSSGTYNPNSSLSGNQLDFNESANIYILQMNGDIAPFPSWDPVPASTADYYYRATLDFDGVFTQYAYPKNSNTNDSWQPLQSIPENICKDIYNDVGSGACGYNSYCSIQNRKPSCDCPPQYVFNDPNDRFSGCKPSILQGCGVDDATRNPEELFETREIRNVDWPNGDYERLSPFNQTECETSCLHDCSCVVAIYQYEDNTCWKKKLPLSNGRFDNARNALFKVRKGVPTSGSSKNKERILSVSLLGGSAFLNALLLVVISLIFSKKHYKKVKEEVHDSNALKTNLCSFTYKELEEATDGFKEELGRGSFGIVYKGVLKAGSEWFKNVPVTAKVDVYSFGVMLLEIISCRRSVVMEMEEEEQAIIADWAYDCYVQGRIDDLLDDDKEATVDKCRLHRWVIIAIWCIEEDPSKRPTMKMVMQMLEGFVEVPLPPCT